MTVFVIHKGEKEGEKKKISQLVLEQMEEIPA